LITPREHFTHPNQPTARTHTHAHTRAHTHTHTHKHTHTHTHTRTHAGTVDEAGYLFKGQAVLQVTLLLVAFVAVPWMLLPKPLILKKRHEASLRAVSRG